MHRLCACSSSRPEPTQGDLLVQGQGAYASQDFGLALEILLPLAQQGNSVAACHLGLMCELVEVVAEMP